MAESCLIIKFLVLVSVFSSSEAVLDPYIPALRNVDAPRDDLIEQYFKLGFDRSEILTCLALLHGIQLRPCSLTSLCHIDRYPIVLPLPCSSISTAAITVVKGLREPLLKRPLF